MKPNCYNRQAFKATVIVQGREDVNLKEMLGVRTTGERNDPLETD